VESLGGLPLVLIAGGAQGGDEEPRHQRIPALTHSPSVWADDRCVRKRKKVALLHTSSNHSLALARFGGLDKHLEMIPVHIDSLAGKEDILEVQKTV